MRGKEAFSVENAIYVIHGAWVRQKTFNKLWCFLEQELEVSGDFASM